MLIFAATGLRNLNQNEEESFHGVVANLRNGRSLLGLTLGGEGDIYMSPEDG
jgi:hypothetical protein